MTDVELLVRETLRAHDADVPAFEAMEARPIAMRARRRQLVNAIGAGLVALVIGLGVASGVGAILRAEGRQPAIQPTPTPTSPPSPTDEVAVGRVGFASPGAEPSLPVDGDVVITVSAEVDSGLAKGINTEILIFADGRMIWRRDRCDYGGAYGGCEPLVRSDVEREPVTGWVEQRLTPETISMLRDELVATGFFERDHLIDKPFDELIDWFTVSVTVNGGVVTVRTNSNYFVEPLSSHQMRALMRMEELVADPGTTLPDSAFADRRITGFVPSNYTYAFRWKPTAADLAELPSPADVLVDGACGTVTTEEARSIVQALDTAAVRRLESDRSTIAYAWGGDQERQQFRLEPVLPDGVPRC